MTRLRTLKTYNIMTIKDENTYNEINERMEKLLEKALS